MRVAAPSPIFSATLSVFREESVAGELVSELHACLGGDLQVASAAVGDEIVWLDYGSIDLDPMLSLQLALSGLECLYEFGVRPGQRVRILHNCEDARIVLRLIPGQSHSANLHDEISIGRRKIDGDAAGRDPQGLGRLAGGVA